MCMIGFALCEHPDFPFVLYSNRDEMWKRGTDSTVPSISSDTKIVCGIDKKASGTWMGLNTENGNFSGLTNIGPATGAISRGLMCQQFIINPTEKHLDYRSAYGGFNLIWGNIFSDAPQINYTSNCYPATEKIEITRFSDGVHAVGNELFGDERVKSPYMEGQLRRILDGVPSSTYDTISKDSVESLRDQLGVVLTTQQPVDSWGLFLHKFFAKSLAGRRQPGLHFTMMIFVLLWTILQLIGVPWILGFTVALTVGLSIGLWFHSKMQHLFVSISLPNYAFGTVSQTIIIKTRGGHVYYYYRKILSVGGRTSAWTEFELPVNKKQ